ncbi:hypothetical protein B0A55_02971 [Friedmanniomyces simplex]|uniref:Uncharacterized protein n=1 Tax=Friedmanniomyces simplex TaxID=329884 RepID=A0A4U0Y379_9PEZI|nr:hypothetical protein B0A55_02971 [Friedmanniomyces simplex]
MAKTQQLMARIPHERIPKQRTPTKRTTQEADGSRSKHPKSGQPNWPNGADTQRSGHPTERTTQQEPTRPVSISTKLLDQKQLGRTLTAVWKCKKCSDMTSTTVRLLKIGGAEVVDGWSRSSTLDAAMLKYGGAEVNERRDSDMKERGREQRDIGFGVATSSADRPDSIPPP